MSTVDPRAAIPVQWELAAGWGVIDRPADAENGGRLYAAPLDRGGISVLDGPSAVVARAALGGADVTGIRNSVAKCLGVDLGDVDEKAVEDLVAELVTRGLLRGRRPDLS